MLKNIAVANDGTIVQARENNYFASYRHVEADELASHLNVPRVSGVGLNSKIPRFPYAMWLQVMGFHRWSYRTFKQETHLSHFITKDGEFITFPFHQTVSGMTIKIDLTSAENKELLSQMIAEHGIDIGGFHGTTHNHVVMSAFQSGTDKADEQDQQGVHFTIGNLDKPEASIHGRVSAIFNGDISLIQEGQPIPEGAKIMKKMIDLAPVTILAFLDIPDLDKNFREMPKEYIDAAISRYVTGIGHTNHLDFPEEWKGRVTEKKYQPHHFPASVPGVGMGSVNARTSNYSGGSVSGLNSNQAYQLKNLIRTGLTELFNIYETNNVDVLFSAKEFMDLVVQPNTPDTSKIDTITLALALTCVREASTELSSLIKLVHENVEWWDSAWNSFHIKVEEVAPIHTWALCTKLFDSLPVGV